MFAGLAPTAALIGRVEQRRPVIRVTAIRERSSAGQVDCHGRGQRDQGGSGQNLFSVRAGLDRRRSSRNLRHDRDLQRFPKTGTSV